MPNPFPSPSDLVAALRWQIELGADEAILDQPVDRFTLPTSPPARRRDPGAGPVPAPAGRPEPRRASAPAMAGTAMEAPSPALVAASCDSLEALHAAMAEFDGCALKKGARSLVFADGIPGARVMIIGEAPGREEDMKGKPFVGRSGQLLDRMFAAIGLSRTAADPAHGLYITNTVPWRPPQNREPSPDEIAMMKPFLMRHIALAAPRLLVLMGRPAAQTLLGTTTGITRLRGRWAEVEGIPALPMFHPAALLRDPLKKRETWADLLALKARLEP